MIDWDSETWGGGVTFAANGSWVTDEADEEAVAKSRRLSSTVQTLSP